MRAIPTFAALLALSAPATAQEVLDDAPIAGIGAQGCETVTGIENMGMLAGAVDWSLGYLAGRQDAGDVQVEGSPLVLTEPADLAVAIRLYCDANPYSIVLDALRDYGTRAFASGPAAEPGLQPRIAANVRPVQRPAEWPPARPDGEAIVVAAGPDAYRLASFRPELRPPELGAVLSTRSTEGDAVEDGASSDDLID